MGRSTFLESDNCGVHASEEPDIQDLLDSLKDSKLLSEEAMDRAARASNSAVNCTSFAQSLVSRGVFDLLPKAGLNLLKKMKVLDAQLSSDQKLELNPWVAIHTGQAVAEVHDGAASLVGDARNVAVRFEDVAQIWQVVCSAATHRLIAGHFECASLASTKSREPEQARAALEAIYETYSEGLTTPDLVDAKSLLAQLGGLVLAATESSRSGSNR